MTIIRALLYGLIIYLVIKIVRFVTRMFTIEIKKREQQHIHTKRRPVNKQYENVEDIDFEEVDSKNND